MSPRLLGVALILGGILFMLPGSFLGHLPGDLSFHLGKNIKVFFPIGTCFLVGIIMAIAMRLLGLK